MDLWGTRKESLATLERELSQESNIIQEIFQLQDKCILFLVNSSKASSFTGICGLVLIKSRNLALACYSLALDGLAQESGALLRPLIETLELLTYFKNDPARAEEAINGKLPKAGVIAKKNQGGFKKLRDYLNTHASHFGFTYESMQHLIDSKTGEVKQIQPHNIKVLRMNMGMLFLFQAFVVSEAINCLINMEITDANRIADSFEECKKMGLGIFFPKGTAF